MSRNPLNLQGIEFVEFCSPKPDELDRLFLEFGFSRCQSDKGGNVLYQQNDINFILTKNFDGHSGNFASKHGPSISSMGFRVQDAKVAFEQAVKNGARPATKADYQLNGQAIPVIYGIGDSLIYFLDSYHDQDFYRQLGFKDESSVFSVENKGFIRIDHLTNNVYKGTMQKWSDFYKDIFGFTEVRYFDIKGVKTGLISYALQSPCQTFCIPLNEGTEKKSQINEYLDEYKGPGIQHIAFLTDDIIKSLEALSSTEIETLDIDDDYYQEVFDRVPNVTESHRKLKELQILVDGDEEGYLLQIFTQNVIGPIFIEVIQRKNHDSFGEGNFGALFRSIEKSQENRGYLD